MKASQFPDSIPRFLSTREKSLFRCLLQERSDLVETLDRIQVIEMDDGNMGSLYIIHPDKSRKGRFMSKAIAEREFLDEDNVPISVTINVDQDGDLFELDIWKVNFEPPVKYPSC